MAIEQRDYEREPAEQERDNRRWYRTLPPRIIGVLALGLSGVIISAIFPRPARDGSLIPQLETYGGLSVVAGDARIYEVAPDRVAVDAADHRVVPGEHFRVEQDFDITLHGENLVAELDLYLGNNAAHDHDGWEVITEDLLCEKHGNKLEIVEQGLGRYRFSEDYRGDAPVEEFCTAVFEIAFLTDEHHSHLYAADAMHHGTLFQGDTLKLDPITATLTQVG